MPAHRKSLSELEASGAIAKNPGRFKNRTESSEPKKPLGKAPRHLSEEQQKVWRELVAATEEGMLSAGDAIMVEIVVRLTMKMRAGEMTKTSEHIALANQMEKLGMTPVGRTRFDIPAPKKQDDDSGLDELD